MNPKVTTSIVIGIIIGTMLFPMILIPLMGIGVVIWALYLLIHDVIMPYIHENKHEHT
jgi:hypothetical protein